jgi:hypothetical protein
VNGALALLQGRPVPDAPAPVATAVARALAREEVRVSLEDGTALSLDDAERLLARKEERRAHRPLRGRIDVALRPVRYFVEYESDALWQEFLTGTRALAEAATETLATLAGEGLEDAAALGRALDLPEPWCDARAALQLVAGARDAAGSAARAVRVPRALAGAVFAEDRRFGVVEPVFRHDRFARVVRGGMCAVDGVGARAEAAGLAALAEAGKGDRPRRLAAVTGLLRARGLAALVVGGAGWRDALAETFHVDPTAALRELVDAPLCDTAAIRARARAAIEAAAAALVLRDAFDERFFVRPEAWHLKLPALAEPVSAWSEWCGPLL